MSRDVHNCSHWLRPRNPHPPPPAFGLIYEGRYWSAKIEEISLKPPDSTANLQDLGDPAPVLDDAELDEETGQTVLVILLTGAGDRVFTTLLHKRNKDRVPNVHKGRSR
jgi:hypothetical protein